MDHEPQSWNEAQPWNRLDAGRHAIDEDALLTPIFAALTRGGWRQRQSAETERFRRDPLTAPLPAAPLPAGPLPAGPPPAGPPPLALVPSQEGGRHHLRRMHSYATA